MSQIRTTEALERAIERVTKAVKQIDNDHAYIHKGGLFSVFIRNTLATNVDRYISIVTPNGNDAKYVHYRNERVMSSGDKVSIELFEDATVEADTGTEKTPINHRRVNSHNPTVTVRDGVTVTNEGTLINQSFIGGGTGQGQARSGEETSDKNEYILKQGATYIVKITNLSDADNVIQCNPLWYEEDEG